MASVSPRVSVIRRSGIAAVAALAALAAGGTLGAQVPADIVCRTELLADTGAVRPGTPFTIGVLFRLRPGWHLYWKHPGDAGRPTEVTFTVPEGFALGPVRWPVPVRFDQGGQVAGYGYEELALLSAVVTPPARLAEGSEVEIRAEAAWLACGKVCSPGSATMEMQMTASRQVVAVHEGVFRAWEKRVPVEAASPESPLSAATAGAIPEGGSSGSFAVDLEWKEPPGAVEWFAAPEAALKIVGARVLTEGRRTRIAFTAEVLQGQALRGDVLETVVGYDDGKGTRRGVSVPVRLRPAAKARAAGP